MRLSIFGIALCLLAVTATTRANVLLELAKVLDLPERKLRECTVESHLTNADITKLERIYKTGEFPDEDLEEFLLNCGCFISCALEKSGIIEDKKILADRFVQAVERNHVTVNDEVRGKMNDCVGRANEQDDVCKLGLAFSVCLFQQFKN